MYLKFSEKQVYCVKQVYSDNHTYFTFLHVQKEPASCGQTGETLCFTSQRSYFCWLSKVKQNLWTWG